MSEERKGGRRQKRLNLNASCFEIGREKVSTAHSVKCRIKSARTLNSSQKHLSCTVYLDASVSHHMQCGMATSTFGGLTQFVLCARILRRIVLGIARFIQEPTLALSGETTYCREVEEVRTGLAMAGLLHLIFLFY